MDQKTLDDWSLKLAHHDRRSSPACGGCLNPVTDMHPVCPECGMCAPCAAEAAEQGEGYCAACGHPPRDVAERHISLLRALKRWHDDVEEGTVCHWCRIDLHEDESEIPHTEDCPWRWILDACREAGVE